jgi:hypothetical protein
VKEIPWLPNGPIPVQVDWRLEGYERISYAGTVDRALTAASVAVPEEEAGVRA